VEVEMKWFAQGTKVVDESGRLVVSVSDPDAEKRAVMIAAAPDGLDLAQKFVELFRGSDMRPEDECHELYCMAKAFITKATGAGMVPGNDSKVNPDS
jgi:hypothetical protein